MRALIIGKITQNLCDLDTNKAGKYILKNFPLISWEPIHNNALPNDDSDPFQLVGSQNIIALGYRLKIPLVHDCVVSSAANQIIEYEEDDIFDCSAVDIIDSDTAQNIKTVQTNHCSKQSYYSNYKKKLILQMEDDNDVLHKTFMTGIKSMDLLNPFKKHGLNVIITPKQCKNVKIFKKIGKNQLHIIYADLFENNLDAMSVQNELYQNEEDVVTVIAGNVCDSDWFQLQTAITAATIAKHDENASDAVVIIPNGNGMNQAINNLHKNVCGGLSKLKFENDEEIGHKAYDWIQKRNKRNKPESASEFYLSWGIEPVSDGPTYIIGLRMDSEELTGLSVDIIQQNVF